MSQTLGSGSHRLFLPQPGSRGKVVVQVLGLRVRGASMGGGGPALEGRPCGVLCQGVEETPAARGSEQL